MPVSKRLLTFFLLSMKCHEQASSSSLARAYSVLIDLSGPGHFLVKHIAFEFSKPMATINRSMCITEHAEAEQM